MNDATFANWMKRLAAAEPESAPPDCGPIWWRAELRRRLAAEERAARPTRIAERVAWTACLVGTAALSPWLAAIPLALAAFAAVAGALASRAR